MSAQPVVVRVLRHPCTVCGSWPVAMRGVKYCFECWPGGPVIPPPCMRCGATSGYFTSGLCQLCHPDCDPGVDSCLDCYAWGATREYRWYCRGCVGFRRKNLTVAECASCRRRLRVGKYGVCRLCFKTASLRRRDHSTLDVIGANRDGQQLFLADMFRRGKELRPRGIEPEEPTVPAPPPANQLMLFEVKHDLATHGRTGLIHRAEPVLAAQLEARARTMATELGWSATRLRDTCWGLRVVLGLRDDDGPIKASTVEQLRDIALPKWTVLRVLDQADLLDDDRIPVLDAWVDRQLHPLPEPMTTELATWFRLMKDGNRTPPRRRPRSPTTIKVHLHRALPILQAWADAGHSSLREITTEHVASALPAAGDARAWAGEGLRSIFMLLKQHRVLFDDPTRRVKTGKHSSRQPLPVNLELARAALNSDNPARAALTALIAFHGLRVTQLQALHLTDLRDGRLHTDGRTIVLAQPVQDRLASYLDYRAQRWPNTANPHLFVHYRTHSRTDPVGRYWVWQILGPGLSPTSLRDDRILDEAHATGGDLRRLADLFGLGIEAGTRYTDTIAHPDLVDTDQD